MGNDMDQDNQDVLAPGDPRNLTHCEPTFDVAQFELELVWDHASTCGWQMASYPRPGEIKKTLLWFTAVDPYGNALLGGSSSRSGVIERVALAMILRDPDQARRLAEIFSDCGWRSEIDQDTKAMTLVLDQPDALREKLMQMLDPDAPEVVKDGIVYAPMGSVSENLNALVPGSQMAHQWVEMMASALDLPLRDVEKRRSAGICARGGSEAECVLAAITHLRQLT